MNLTINTQIYQKICEDHSHHLSEESQSINKFISNSFNAMSNDDFDSLIGFIVHSNSSLIQTDRVLERIVDVINSELVEESMQNQSLKFQRHFEITKPMLGLKDIYLKWNKFAQKGVSNNHWIDIAKSGVDLLKMITEKNLWDDYKKLPQYQELAAMHEHKYKELVNKKLIDPYELMGN